MSTSALSEGGWHILGAGAIGCLCAQGFARAGVSITLVLRQGAECGPIEIEDGEHLEKLTPASAYPDSCNNISHLLVTTKAYDAVAAVASVSHALRQNATLVLLVNGMGIAERIQANHPEISLYCATTTAGAHRLGPRRIRRAGDGETRIGRQGQSVPESWYEDWKRAMHPCHWDRDINAALWHKLAINAAINPLTAIHRCSNGTLARRSALALSVRELCGEIKQISDAAGYQHTARTLTQSVDAVIAATAANRSSMLQDIEARRSTEIDYITGYLLDTAERLGIPAPHNQKIYHEVKALAH